LVPASAVLAEAVQVVDCVVKHAHGLYVAVKGFFIWKIWDRKNWARLTMLAWFLHTYIQYFIQPKSGAAPIQIETGLKVVTVALEVAQACSLALLFTRSSNDWFRPAPAKENLLFPR
jgi:hypothetical protein